MEETEKQQTAFSVSFTIAFVVIGLVGAALIFAKSYRRGTADAVPTADVGLGTNPLYSPDGPSGVTPPAVAAGTGVGSERRRKVHRVLHVVHAVMAIYMLVTALVGLGGTNVWSAIVATSPNYVYTTYLDLRQVEICLAYPGIDETCNSGTLRYLSDVNQQYFAATFTAGIVVSALLSLSLAASVFVIAVNAMSVVPRLKLKVRGWMQRISPYVLAVPWALLLAAIIVWGACVPYKYIADTTKAPTPASSVLVLRSAVWMIITSNVLGFMSLIAAIVSHRPRFIARYNGVPLTATGAVIAAPLQALSPPVVAYGAPGAAATPAPVGAGGDWVQLTTLAPHPYWWNNKTGALSWTPPTQAVTTPVDPTGQAYPQIAQLSAQQQPVPQVKPSPGALQDMQTQGQQPQPYPQQQQQQPQQSYLQQQQAQWAAQAHASAPGQQQQPTLQAAGAAAQSQQHPIHAATLQPIEQPSTGAVAAVHLQQSMLSSQPAAFAASLPFPSPLLPEPWVQLDHQGHP